MLVFIGLPIVLYVECLLHSLDGVGGDPCYLGCVPDGLPSLEVPDYRPVLCLQLFLGLDT